MTETRPKAMVYLLASPITSSVKANDGIIRRQQPNVPNGIRYGRCNSGFDILSFIKAAYSIKRDIA
jgi:hypothetical protein